MGLPAFEVPTTARDPSSFFASQRRTFAPIKNTKDWRLFQSFRYGKDKLKFEFDLEDGEYLVELYFIEPWLGIGGGMDAKGMRLFDVARSPRASGVAVATDIFFSSHTLCAGSEVM